ncbi:MAG TPA: porin [Stellaceae bacterium]|nr:porin [Stellaceae bacterium]
MLIGTAIIALGCGPASASDVDDLKAEIALLRARLDQLERKQSAVAASQAKGTAAASQAAASAAKAQAAADDAQAKTQAQAQALAQAQAKTAAQPTTITAQAAAQPTATGFLPGPVDDLKKGEPVRILETSGTSVSLYGLLEATISTISNSDTKGDRTTGYQVSWFSGNRWGIDGRQTLDADSKLEIIGKLESEFELPTGSMDTAGVLFNRDAWLGFQSPTYGKLTFGRQNTLPRDFSQIYGDPYGTANVTLNEGGYTNVNNFKQLIFYSGGGKNGDTRYDNGIVYKKAFDDGLTLGAAYRLGGVAGGGLTVGSAQAAALAYNAGDFNASVFYNHSDEQSGTTKTGKSHQSVGIGGNYQLGLFRLDAGYLFYTADQGVIGTRSDNAFTTSVKFAPAGKFDYELGYQIMMAHNAGYNSSGYTFNAYQDASGATKAGSGNKQTVYGSVFYRPVKNTDIYIAGDYMKLDGGYRASQSNGFMSQVEFATGVRWKF